MLKLDWQPGAPMPRDSANWPLTNDWLCDGGGRLLQAFARPDSYLPNAAPHLPDAERLLQSTIGTWHQSDGTIVVMVHGFQYAPSKQGAADDPFRWVYGWPASTGPDRLDARLSWLPLVGECDESGANRIDTAVAFAWVSEGSDMDGNRACWSNYYQYPALDLAPLAARALATVLGQLSACGLRVHILAHSLGTRTTSQAIGLARTLGLPLSVERAVLLGGAEFCVDAAANFADCSFDVINVASRDDLVLAGGAEKECAPYRPEGTIQADVIGRRGLGGSEHWLDLFLDDRHLVDWCASGAAPTGERYAITAKAPEDDPHQVHSLNHWSYYTVPGNRVFVRDLLLNPQMDIKGLRAKSVPSRPADAGFGPYATTAVPTTPMTRAEREGYSVEAGAGSGTWA